MAEATEVMLRHWQSGLLVVVACCAACPAPRAADAPVTASSLGSASGTGSDQAPPGLAPTATARCTSYRQPVARWSLPASVDEASGLAVDGDGAVLFLHNDSGDAARLYAVDAETGGLLATIVLDGVIALDWEDMARGPCAEGVEGGGGACLYVADIGDNYHLRPWISVYRLPIPNARLGDARLRDYERMDLVYPDRARDAEAIAVDDQARVWVLTKERDGTFHLYSAPFGSTSSAVPLSFHGSHDISALPARSRAMVTAADYDPELNRLLVRTYNAVIEYRLPAGLGLDHLDQAEVVRVPADEEAQGESIAYAPGGYWHVSEGPSPPAYFVACDD